MLVVTCAGYLIYWFASSHRNSEDGFSTEAVDIMDKLFGGIQSVATRIYKGVIIIEKGCANLTRFMGTIFGGENSLKSMVKRLN